MTAAPDLALESFEAAIERDSRCGAAHLERALLLWLVDRETVIYDLERCIDAGFSLGAAFSYKGLLLDDLERTEEATTAYRKATEVAPDFPGGWYLRGLTAVKQGRYEESIAATSRTLELAPRHASSYYTLKRGRVQVSHDASTMTAAAYARIEGGGRMPGVIIVPQWLSIGEALDDLVLVVECSEAGDWENRVQFLPLG